MHVAVEELEGVIIIEPKVFGDDRGFFLESYQRNRYKDLGIGADFLQQNLSRSRQGVLRGMHYQLQQPQGKLCYVVRGEVYDAFIDLRRQSRTFGCWGATTLDDQSHRQVYIPPGFAHGFYVVSEEVDFAYHCTDFYDTRGENTILWNDPEVGIEWPCNTPTHISEKDQLGVPFCKAPYFP